MNPIVVQLQAAALAAVCAIAHEHVDAGRDPNPHTQQLTAYDALLCTADLPCTTGAQLCQRERPAYAADIPLSMAPISQTGHSITLHRTAAGATSIANRWITGRTSRDPRVTTCPA